ncbi:MAG: DUF4333 domain-containing protein [Euzebya sp.]
MRKLAVTRIAVTRIAVVLHLAVLLAGCSGFSLSFGGLDTGPLEQRIEADLETQASGIDIDRVECPGDVKPQAGRVFVCRAFAVDGSIGTVEVQQVDDAGSVTWELTDVAAPQTE